jgi:hypothetical protein
MIDSFRVFAESDLRTHLETLIHNLARRIDGETPDYILNVNESNYVNFLVKENEIEPLNVDFAAVSVSDREEFVEAERFPGGGFEFNVMQGRRYKKHIITYHLPVAGDLSLLRLVPSSRLMWTTAMYLEHGNLCFDVIDFYGDPERLKAEASQTIDNFRRQLENVTRDVRQYNEKLPAIAREAFTKRRAVLIERGTVLTSLGVPIRKSSSIPSTFTVPTVPKKVFSKPSAPDTRGAPVPTLDEAVYRDILQVVYDTGKVFERLPSTYRDKDEEALRDHLILVLEPRFEGSTTGETFNKTGKTDILIRHEKKNVFVAECKFWGGAVQHAKTIDQILSYLTWRDSKTAIIYFVKQKTMTPVVQVIATETAQHPCFVRQLAAKDPSWHMFEFHLPGDEGCKITLAVLAFHLPP